MCPVASIVVAAGKGKRMGTKTRKQYLDLQGIPVLAHTLRVFENATGISRVVLVVPEDDIEYCETSIKNKFGFKKIAAIVGGGDTRGESVFNGLKSVPRGCNLVAVHDGARPLLNVQVLDRAIEAAGEYGAAVTAVRVKDTIKSVNQDKFVQATLPREKLWAIQTPQVFKTELLYKCYRRAFKEGISGTDDSSIVEYYGYSVKIIEGDYENIKITTPGDLILADAILTKRRERDAGRIGL